MSWSISQACTAGFIASIPIPSASFTNPNVFFCSAVAVPTAIVLQESPQ
jgi:hypothetical protein